MPNVQGQINAQRQQQQQNLQADLRLTQEQIRNGGYSAAELEKLEMQRKELEDEFFRQIVHDEKYKELGNLQNYLRERNQKAWTQTFDECEKKSQKIFAKFRKLYSKNAGKKNWEERSSDLAQLKEEALALTETMTKRDQAQQAIRDNANFTDFDAEIKVLIEKSSDSDSPTYKAVVAAAKEYVATKDLSQQLDIIWRMQACMKEYAKLRYKTKYGTKEGKRRMDQVTKLLAMTDKFLEFQEFIELKKQNDKSSDAMNHEVKYEEAAEFEETKQKYNKITTNKLLDSRWYQICLPYKRDKEGNVTKDTQENYNTTMKFLRAYQSNNTKRQLAAIARIYLKQNLPDFTREDLTADNSVKLANAMFGKDIQRTNKSILTDFIKDLSNRTKAYDVLLSYMGRRIGDPTLGVMTTTFQLHALNAGIDPERMKKINKDRPSKKKVEQMLDQAKAAYEIDHQALDPELEDQLRTLIAEVDKEEQEEKQKPSSPEYLKELCLFQTKKRKLYEDKAETLIKERYSDYMNTENKYWKKNDQMSSLLLPYAVNKDKQVTSKSEQFFKYNEKLIPLLHSEDPEDRIAALASVFLRLRKFNYAKNRPVSSTIAEYDKQMLGTPGFVSQYRAFGDFLAEEEKRSSDHPMIKYMKKVYENPLTDYSLNLVYTNRYAHGYDDAGNFFDNAELEKTSKNSFDATVKLVNEEIKRQKAENNDKLAYTDETEDAKLKQLCESRGLEVFK